MTIAKFTLLEGTKGVYRSTNSQDDVTIIKDIGCWTLEIVHADTGRCIHLSSHNTWDEAVREAEMRTCWTTNFGFDDVDDFDSVDETPANMTEDEAYELMQSQTLY
jgi:hypothetical protein